MTRTRGSAPPRGKGWLLFFYSVPSRPVANRIRVWRRLTKAGAVQLKGAVYALPDNEDHRELFQWLVSEVGSMKGEAAFVKAERIETANDEEITGAFDRQREKDYRAVLKELDSLERKVSAVKKGSGTPKDAGLTSQLARCMKRFEDIRKVDFFSSSAGTDIKRRLAALEAEVSGLQGPGARTKDREPRARMTEDYRGRVWVTRTKPFVDRMASAWLIRRFVDEDARFGFVEGDEAEGPGDGIVAFDIRGGEFTHVGDRCTFEVIMKAFGLKGSALKAMAEVVHELDMKDDGRKNPEARGVEEILSGIRKTARDDAEALEKGMAVFEMLYASKV